MRKIGLLISSFLMISLLCSFFNLFFWNSLPADAKMAYKITREIGKKIETKYGLNYNGISEEGENGKYKRIGFELTCCKILTKEEGRLLLLNCLNEALTTFNSHPEFEKYVVNFPLTGKNILINIFVNPDGRHEVYYPKVAVFSFFNDTLWYKTNSPENIYVYYSEEEESYSDAIRIINEQEKLTE